MRLINTSTGEMETFVADPPPYAILSHRWREGEVSFQDYKDKARRTQMKGYSKIRFFRSLAKTYSLNWVWVDTCCIDKSDSAELSEAVNSMFKWYRMSNICYAYLDDVESDDGLLTSTWFTRGWTLQELIAPRELEFWCNNDQGWQHLGTKDLLADQLSRRTRIPKLVLKKSDEKTITSYTVAMRMSWAAGRETTRPEDMAYCLLGIFDINMPLLYGEGSNAFLRLQQEILANISDHTIFAWTVPPNSYLSRPGSGLFAGSPMDFVNSTRLVCRHDVMEANQIETTAKGLRTRTTAILTPVQRIRETVHERGSFILLPLNCSPYKNEYYTFSGVMLRWCEGNRYSRVFSDKLFEVNEVNICKDTTIFIERFKHRYPSPTLCAPGTCRIEIRLPDEGTTLIPIRDFDGRYIHSYSRLEKYFDPGELDQGISLVLPFDVGGVIALVGIALGDKHKQHLVVRVCEPNCTSSDIRVARQQLLDSLRSCCPLPSISTVSYSVQEVVVVRPNKYSTDVLNVSLSDLDGKFSYLLKLSFKASRSWRISGKRVFPS